MTTVKEKYGFLPTSVWNLDKGVFGKLLDDSGTAREKRRSENAKYLPGLKFSSFNPELARRVILYWSNEGDAILDPFAGRSTRMVVASVLRRNYDGFEISPVAFEELKRQSETRQSSLSGTGAINLHLSDGCKLEGIPNNSIDFIFTCPPYWNLERYESVLGQLSDCPTYDDFLMRLRECAHHCFDVLKPDKFAAWVVADFRKDGFKALHKDCIDIFISSGFVLWDIVVNVLHSPFAWCQIGKCDTQKYTSKNHEYVLVFKKQEAA